MLIPASHRRRRLFGRSRRSRASWSTPRSCVSWGVVTFRFPARPKWDQIVSVFGADRFSGQAVESDEIAPQWFSVDDLPLAKMWDDARLWLPQVLARQYVTAEITFAGDCEIVSEARFGESAV